MPWCPSLRHRHVPARDRHRRLPGDRPPLRLPQVPHHGRLADADASPSPSRRRPRGIPRPRRVTPRLDDDALDPRRQRRRRREPGPYLRARQAGRRRALRLARAPWRRRCAASTRCSAKYRAPTSSVSPTADRSTRCPSQQGIVHRVIRWDDVSDAEGTGIVHIAPGAGAEDFALSKEYNLAVIAPLEEDGTYTVGGGFGFLEGRFAGDVPQHVFDSLQARRASSTACRTTPTATPPAGAAAPSSSSAWSTNGSSPWTGTRARTASRSLPRPTSPPRQDRRSHPQGPLDPRVRRSA